MSDAELQARMRETIGAAMAEAKAEHQQQIDVDDAREALMELRSTIDSLNFLVDTMNDVAAWFREPGELVKSAAHRGLAKVEVVEQFVAQEIRRQDLAKQENANGPLRSRR